MVSTVSNALNSHSLKYQKIVDRPNQVVFRMGIGLENGRSDCFIDLRILEEQILISTVCPVSIPENKRLLMSEFVTRANCNLIIGSFEMDFDDGELKYKCNYLFNADEMRSEIIFLKNLFLSFQMMDKYIPGIMSVLFANITPKSAIDQIENNQNPILN